MEATGRAGELSRELVVEKMPPEDTQVVEDEAEAAQDVDITQAPGHNQSSCLAQQSAP